MATQPFVWLNEKTEGATGSVKYGENGGWSGKRIFEAYASPGNEMMSPIEAVFCLNLSYTTGSPPKAVFEKVPVKDQSTVYCNGGTGYLPAIGDAYVLTGGQITWGTSNYAPFCKSITPTRPSNDRLLWRYECEYGYSSDSNNGNTNPLRAPWEITLGMQQVTQRAMFYAYNGLKIQKGSTVVQSLASITDDVDKPSQPLITTAGDHFYDPPMQDVGCLVITATKNFQLMTATTGTSNAQATESDELMKFDPTVICNYRDTTNASAITLLGFPEFAAETCRMRDISVKPGRWRKPGLMDIVTYLSVTFVIEYCPIGWLWIVANRGPNYKVASGGKPTNAVPSFLEAQSSAAQGMYEFFLDKDGMLEDPTVNNFNPTLLGFRVKYPKDWSKLPLPPTKLNKAIVSNGGYTGGV